METKSAWASRINWTAAISALLTLLAAFGLPISEEMKVQIMALVGTLSPIAVILLKTFFTTTITPAAAARR